MSKADFRALAAKHHGVVEIPDLSVWVADSGEWGVGELVVVDATKWLDTDFIDLSQTHHSEVWGKAVAITKLRSNK
jgi:hypothetical protein